MLQPWQAGCQIWSNSEDLREPSLAAAAVAGAMVWEEPDESADLAEPSAEELAIARELVRSARARGVAMTGVEELGVNASFDELTGEPADGSRP